MTTHNLISYQSAGGPRSGLLLDENTVLDVAQALEAHGGPGAKLFDRSVLGLLDAWDQTQPILADVAARFAGGALKLEPKPLAEVSLLAPILYPRAIFAAAANYSEHIREWTGSGLPPKDEARPLFFQKAGAHSVVGTGVDLHFPRPDSRLFYESELGVVIGKRARRVAANDAL